MPDAAFPARSTPFPSRLLDDVMPLLSDTEWRVLCVVVRATLGWNDGQGGRKQADWLTQSQLKARTGRASEALSRAIDGLVHKGLIRVCSEAGELLSTPQERRRCPGRLLFGLAPQVLDAPQAAPGMRLGNANSQSERGYSEGEETFSPSELRKANTTKETGYKTTPGGVRPEKRQDGEKAVDKSVPEKAEPGGEKVPERPASDVRRFLLAYQEQFAKNNARGEFPPIAWGRDGKLVKGLLAQYGYERLRELLARFFASEDGWVRKRGYALSCFPTLLPTLLMQDGRTLEAQGQEQARTRVEEAQRRARATPVVVHGPSAQHWQQSGDVSASKASLFERHPDLARRVRGQSP